MQMKYAITNKTLNSKNNGTTVIFDNLNTLSCNPNATHLASGLRLMWRGKG